MSIIMPYYNAAKYIDETVDAIIAQTYENWELLIVDDCSPATDTLDVLNAVATKDFRIITLCTVQNGGAGVARNVAIREARGRYIAFCDSDDWWYPTKLEEQMKFMQENNYEFVCTYYEDANEMLEPYYTMQQPARQNYNDMISGCNIGTPGVIFDTQRIGKRYMPEMRRSEDWGLWMTILKEVDYLYTYPKALWKYRHVPGSESSNKWELLKAVALMYRQVLGFSFIKSWFVCLFIFLHRNVIKKLKKIVNGNVFDCFSNSIHSGIGLF